MRTGPKPDDLRGDTRLAQWLRDQGMHISTFQQLYDVPRRTLTFLVDPERGWNQPPIKQLPIALLVRVAQATGLTPGDLVNDVVKERQE